MIQPLAMTHKRGGSLGILEQSLPQRAHKVAIHKGCTTLSAQCSLSDMKK